MVAVLRFRGYQPIRLPRAQYGSILSSVTGSASSADPTAMMGPSFAPTQGFTRENPNFDERTSGVAIKILAPGLLAHLEERNHRFQRDQ
jgi:hypothetical protein